MPISKSNLKRHELIGLYVRISKSKNPSNSAIEGRIVNETYHTFEIETQGGIKKIFKNSVILELTLPSGEKVEIEGSEIERRPWDRLKLK